MPCRDEYAERESIQSDRLHKVTRLLCALCKRIEKHGTEVALIHSDLELVGWWGEHKRADAAREQREAQAKKDDDDRAAALAKLTPRQRKLLGV